MGGGYKSSREGEEKEEDEREEGHERESQSGGTRVKDATGGNHRHHGLEEAGIEVANESTEYECVA